MKKKLLLITADFYPYASSNTNCFMPLIKKMISDGWEADIVTRRPDGTLDYSSAFNGLTIYRTDDYRSIKTIEINKWSRGNAAKKLCGVFLKALNYTRYCLHNKEKRYAGWDVRKTVDLCLKLEEENKYDLMMSVSYPFLCHELAYEVKKRNYCNYIFTWDYMCRM